MPSRPCFSRGSNTRLSGTPRTVGTHRLVHSRCRTAPPTTTQRGAPATAKQNDQPSFIEGCEYLHLAYRIGEPLSGYFQRRGRGIWYELCRLLAGVLSQSGSRRAQTRAASRRWIVRTTPEVENRRELGADGRPWLCRGHNVASKNRGRRGANHGLSKSPEF